MEKTKPRQKLKLKFSRMKYLPLPIIAFILFSCSNQKSEKEKQAIDDTTLINNVIIDYYKKEAQKSKQDEPQSQLKIDTTTDGIELKLFLDATSASGELNTIPFSKDFIKGDLNGDKINEVLVPVYSTGGGTAEWQEIFVFTSSQSRLKFYKMISSWDLAHCPEGSADGQFYPKQILNAILIGETYCYQPQDAHCCPSIKRTTQYKFDNGFTFLKQTKLE